MNHRFYEEWLFAATEPTEEGLTVQQTAALQEHLRDCPDCQALAESWQGAQVVLRSQEMAAPAAGFTRRWQARLAAERERAHRRQTLAMLALTLGGALALLASLVILAWPWLQSPNLLWWTWLYRLFTLYAYAGAAQDFLSELFRTATGAVPLVWWVIFAGLFSELGVLWIVSYRLLTHPRRLSQ